MLSRTLPFLLALASAVAGCGASSDTLSSSELTERRPIRSTLNGDSNQGDGAIGASGTLAAAAVAEVVADSCSSSPRVIGSAAVDAQGAFTVDLRGAHRDVVVRLLDGAGVMIGAAMVGTIDAAHDGQRQVTVTLESTVETLVWIEARAEHGPARLISAVDIRARIDASVAAAVDAREELSADGEAAVDASVHALAEASVAAQATRERVLESLYGAFNFAAWLAVEARSEAQAAADASLSLEAAIDARLDAAGIGEEDRAALAAQVELAFRAALRAAADTDDEVIEAAERGSATLEARAAAAASLSIGAAQDAGEAAGESTTAAMTDLFQSLTTTTTSTSECAVDFGAAAEAELEATLEDEIAAAGGITVDLLLDLGFSLGTTVELIVDDILNGAGDAGAELHDDITLAADLATDVYGDVDVDAFAEAVVDAWAEASAETGSHLGSSTWSSAEVEAMASWMLVASGGFSDCE